MTTGHNRTMPEKGQCIGIAVDHTGWWIKYREFARSMGLQHEVFEIERSDWLDRARGYACVLWRPNLDPPYCEEAREKIYFLEYFERKRVFPNWATFWHYDNKRAQAYLFSMWGVPTPQTFVSYSEAEASEFAARATYPLVSKRADGSSSEAVHLLHNQRAAQREIRRVFGRPRLIRALRRLGITLRLSPQSSSANVLWQEFVPGNPRDLRVTVIGGRYGFAFARRNRPGDFRASGSGLVEYDIPEPTEAMQYCISLCREYGFDSMAFDIVYGTKSFLILEMSYIFVDKAVHSAPGYYVMDASDAIHFERGNIWPQELYLRHVRDSLSLA